MMVEHWSTQAVEIAQKVEGCGMRGVTCVMPAITEGRWAKVSNYESVKISLNFINVIESTSFG